VGRKWMLYLAIISWPKGEVEGTTSTTSKLANGFKVSRSPFSSLH